MSFLNTFLKPRPPRLSSITAKCTRVQYNSTITQGECRREFPQSRLNSDDNYVPLPRRQQSRSSTSFEDMFVRSLVQASSCRRCREHTAGVHYASRQRRLYSSRPTYQPYTGLESTEESTDTTLVDSVETDVEPPIGQAIPRSEYRHLVETYDSPSDLWEQPSPSPPALSLPKKLIHLPLAPRLVLTPEQEERPPYAARQILPPENLEHEIALRRFNRLLERPLGTTTKQIWRRYQQLQGPRPRYLTDMAISRVFRHLTWVEFKDSLSSQRYFTFLNEVLAERIPVQTSIWNTSISFAARWLRHTTSEEVKKAIETWLRMENAGVQATAVTFNILFDAAIRAGRFALADTICDEIEQRDLKPDRAFRVSMVYYAGLRRDGDAVRKAFRELVDAGEIVDTTVMNCVIVSLIRAGEGASAENAYLKMKQLHETKFGIAGPRSWRERRARRVEMQNTAHQLRQDKQRHESSFFGGSFSADDKKEEAQRRAPIHPDAHTYRVLIRYNAHTSGNLDRCRELLAQMKEGGWPVHGSIYLYLFKGFYQHGGHAYTAWNRRSLEEIWEDFLLASSPEQMRKGTLWAKAERRRELGDDAPYFAEIGEDDSDGEDDPLSHEDKPPYFTFGLARTALYAFYRCAGRKRLLQVWAQMQECWMDVTPDEKMQLQHRVNRLVVDDSRYVE